MSPGGATRDSDGSGPTASDRQAHLRELMTSVAAAGPDADVPGTVTRVLEAGRTLIGARYVGFATVHPSPPHEVDTFVSVGIDDDTVRRIGRQPVGAGVLAAAMAGQEPLRLGDVHLHPAFQGFPPGHPTLTTLLAVPVAVGAQTLGALYLADKTDNQLFTAEDERMAVALAATVGSAVASHRLDRDARRRQQWLAGTVEVAGALIDAPEGAGGLAVVAEVAARAIAADAVCIAVAAGAGSIRIEAAVGGAEVQALQGELISLAKTPLWTSVLQSRKALISNDAGTDKRVEQSAVVHRLRLGKVLVVPLHAADDVLGVLLVGRYGGEDFERPDAEAATAFAGHAALALEIRRLHEQSQRRHQWLVTAAETTSTLLTVRDRAKALRLVAAAARHVTNADLACVCTATDADMLLIEGATGAGADEISGLLVPVADSPLWRHVAETGQPIRVDNDDPMQQSLRSWRLTEGGMRHVLAVPLADSVDGMLLLANRADQAPFSQLDLDMASAFAGQVAIALELGHATETGEELNSSEIRRQESHDLHDAVIQRLFSIGMTLQGTTSGLAGTAADQMGTVLDRLDDTIHEIRETMSTVRVVSDQPSLTEQIALLLSSTPAGSDLRQRLHLNGSVNQAVPVEWHPLILTVIAQALDASRNAGATDADITMTVDDALIVMVEDNGCAPTTEAEAASHAQLRDLAAEAGADITITARHERHGAVVMLQTPLAVPSQVSLRP